MKWAALAAARRGHAAAGRGRTPWWIGDCRVGSVAQAHLPRLQAWPQHLALDARGLRLTTPAAGRDAALAEINAALATQGCIRGWRDEPVAVVDPEAGPGGGPPLARIERAAARLWGTLTLGAHVNGYVADAQGRPQRLWIAQRAAGKATDPGRLDNLVGGGVAAGQTPWQALLRESWEEAGLGPALTQAARPGRVIRLQRAVAEGWQLEDLHGFDLALPAGLQPANQDGEVQGFACLPVAEALALAAGPRMTVDAALVTLDFALRHALLPPVQAAALTPLLAPWFRGPSVVDAQYP